MQLKAAPCQGNCAAIFSPGTPYVVPSHRTMLPPRETLRENLPRPGAPQADPRLAIAYPQALGPPPGPPPERSLADPRPIPGPRPTPGLPRPTPRLLAHPPERSLTDPRPTPQADPPGRPPPRPTPQAHPLAHPESDAGPIPRRPQAPGAEMRGFLKGGVAAEDGGKWSPLATGG